MKRKNKVVGCLLAGVLLGGLVCGAASVSPSKVASAAVADTAEPYGLHASVSVQMQCNSTQVWASAKNDFTLFPSKVYVEIVLYSSTAYTENVSSMQEEARNSIADLDMGKSIEARADIDGRDLYWRARIRYNRDNGNWVTKETATYYILGDGTLIS